MVSTPKPNGFADHYPYEKWLFHWEYTLFSDKTKSGFLRDPTEIVMETIQKFSKRSPKPQMLHVWNIYQHVPQKIIKFCG